MSLLQLRPAAIDEYRRLYPVKPGFTYLLAGR